MSDSEFGGLRKHEKTQHALVGLGSAALAAAVALLTQATIRRPDFPEKKTKVYRGLQVPIPVRTAT